MVAADLAVDLAAELRAEGISDVSVRDVDRAAYSSDASLFRVVPRAVVRAQHVDELHAVHEVSRRLAVPLTLRGSGTSIAGNAVGPGVVVDTRALNRVLEIDRDARVATVEPGVAIQIEIAGGVRTGYVSAPTRRRTRAPRSVA